MSSAPHAPSTYTFRELLVGDLRACHVPVLESDGRIRLLRHTIHALITRHNFACVFSLRLNAIAARRFPRFAELWGVSRYYRFGNDISYRAHIGPGLRIHHTSDIVIGRAVRIGENCHIYNGVTLGTKSMDKPDDMPTIGNGVIIGTGAKVLGNITIGDHAVIGALTFCNTSVPPHTVAVGNPMRFLDK